MPSAEITINTLPNFAEAVTREVLAGDYTVAIKQVAIAAKADFKRHFEESRGPDGSPWPPIKGFRVRRGSGGFQPLRDRGLLMASAAAEGEGHIEEISQYSMEVGTNLFYAMVHQKGVPSDVWDGRPKRAKALAIPMTTEAYRAGWPSKWTGTKLRLVWPKGKAHGWLVEDKGGRKAKSILHYMLLPRVVIPKREFVGWSPELLKITDGIFLAHMAKLAAGR